MFAALIALAGGASAQEPPTTGTDMEVDPDAPRAEPPTPEQPPLSAAPEGTWGVGGKEEEGRFAPSGKTGALREQEERDDPEEKKPVDLGPAGELSMDTVIGFGEIRDVLNDLNVTEATSVSFVPGLSYRFFEIWTLSARVPFSTAQLAGPQPGADDDYNLTVLGNIEITVRPSFRITRRLRLPAWISFYVPSAPGDPFLPREDPNVNIGRAEALVGQAAAAARGWEANALFAAKRIGFAPGVGLTYDRGAIHGELGTRFEIMVRSGGNEPYAVNENEPTPELRDPTTNWVTTASGRYDFLGGMVSPGLRAWVAVASTPIVVGTRDYAGVQLVVEPTVDGRFPLNRAGTLALRAGLGLLVPVSGHLGGVHDASMNGFRLKASLLF